MKRLFLMMAGFVAIAASAQVVEDFKPASTNQEGRQYPMVNSQRMVRAQISAPGPFDRTGTENRTDLSINYQRGIKLTIEQQVPARQ